MRKLKRHFQICLVVCMLSICVQGQQSIYYDVKFIYENCFDKDDGVFTHKESLYDLLKKYYPPGTMLSEAELKKNPFFEPYVPVSIALAGERSSFFDKGLSAVGNFNVTNFADGIAKFLVKRFKQELSITFFEKFKEEIENREYEDLRILFNQTYRLFRVIDKEIYNFSKYLNSLREAFIKDLGNLYFGLKKVKELPKYQAYFSSHPEINTIVVNAFYFIDQFANGVHPGNIIAHYNPDKFLDFSNANLQTNMRSSVKALKLFSISLKSNSADNYWVSAESVKLLFEDEVTRNLYFGLIYQKSGDINFETSSGSLSFQSLLRTAKATENLLNEYREHIERIIDHAQEINEYIAAIKEKKKSEIDYNDYHKLINASFDILNDGLLIVDLPALNIDVVLKNSIKDKVIECIDLGRNTGELYVDIRTKNYSSAILNVVSIIDAVFGNNYNNKLRGNVLKYGNFIATIANAENSDEVEKAIEAIALPVGSSRIKRESLRNISLNGYVGGFAGAEYLPALNQKRTSFSFGLTAPVGIAFSFGNLGKDPEGKRGGKSFSIFISAIDVGALASFRMNDDSSKVASEVQLKNIIAPGFFLYYGFGKCPISLGAGVQIGPQLREVTAHNVNIDKNYYIRFGISLAVDIPLLNFYTKSQ